jgi:fructokinase
MSLVVALGEMLVDFVASAPGPLARAPSFLPMPGGAPANVAVGIARLGGQSGLLGMVGDDAWGHMLAQTLQSNDVETSGLCFTNEGKTAITFVSLDEDGERDFLFYGKAAADNFYTPHDLHLPLLHQASILHIGSNSLIAPLPRAATHQAIGIAHEHHIRISYDPNIRTSFWQDEATVRTYALEVWQQASLIKVSDDELRFLSKTDDWQQAVDKLWHPYIHILAITHGANGCTCITPNTTLHTPAYPVQPVDTTGAGDSWMAAFLVQLAASPDMLHDPAALETSMRYANAAAALTTTQYGAIPALPTAAQVATFQARSSENAPSLGNSDADGS